MNKNGCPKHHLGEWNIKVRGHFIKIVQESPRPPASLAKRQKCKHIYHFFCHSHQRYFQACLSILCTPVPALDSVFECWQGGSKKSCRHSTRLGSTRIDSNRLNAGGPLASRIPGADIYHDRSTVCGPRPRPLIYTVRTFFFVTETIH